MDVAISMMFQQTFSFFAKKKKEKCATENDYEYSLAEACHWDGLDQIFYYNILYICFIVYFQFQYCSIYIHVYALNA